MNKKTLLLFIIGLFALTTLAIAVSAAEETPNAIESILAPFGSRLEQIYFKYSAFIDAAIYLIIFLGLAQVTLGHRFESRKGGKAITIGVGLIMAIGLAIWETQAGFNIASFGPVAAVVLLALMGYAIWAGIRAMEIEGVDTLTVTAMTYVLVYYSMSAAVPSVIWWINKNVPVVGGLLALIAAAFTIFLIYKIITWMMSLFGSFGGGTGGGETPTPPEGGDKGGAVTTEPGKPKKPDEPEVPENYDELKLAQSDLINAMKKLKYIRDKGSNNFVERLKKWADDWKANEKKTEAISNARIADDALEANMTNHFKDAQDFVGRARSALAGCIRTKKYEAVKDDIRQLTAEVEATLSSTPFHNGLRDCLDYYHRILRDFINGRYNQKPGKKGVYTIYPTQLFHTILDHEQDSIRKGLATNVENALKFVEVNLEKLNHIITKVS